MSLLMLTCLGLAALTSANLKPPGNPLYGSNFGIPGQNLSFDYVVVGGGTAGLTIASRLARDYSVAVIEAGSFYEQENGNRSVIPGFAGQGYEGTAPDTPPLAIDWNFYTTPQEGANGRRMHYARGKCLGGSSALNIMAHNRGTIGSFQRWAEEVGDESYTFANLLPYFQRSPRLTPPDESKRFPNSTVSYDPTAFDNSKGGPWQVTWPKYALALGSWAQRGMEAAGIPISTINFNSGILNGSSWEASSINPVNGHRSSSQASFLTQAIHETDITIYPHTLAQKIVFEEHRQARSVIVTSAGDTFNLTANKEIIVSAGAFQSPQLLMVSGIGPIDTLEKYDIPLVKHLAGVGQNMWDSPIFGVTHRVNVETYSIFSNDPTASARASAEFLQNTGPLTVPGGGGILAWENIPEPERSAMSRRSLEDLAKFPTDWPEVEYLVDSIYLGYATGSAADADPADGYNYGSILTSLIATTSRGNITISSASIEDPPIINPAWLTTKTDAELAVAAFKRVRQIWAHMKGVTIGPEYFPGFDLASSDKEILDFIRQSMLMIFHPSATCKMGRKDDRMAVVDSKARVYGVKGLRVVDASAFPFLVPGHPQSSVYMLAEKIAQDIKTERLLSEALASQKTEEHQAHGSQPPMLDVEFDPFAGQHILS
ncbi:MAG: hypothetical protein M1820_005795 [Bogoriella megaspora]|nr:MAG: hypothetical protein M1820_005795 [Bogoriella megaspora]